MLPHLVSPPIDHPQINNNNNIINNNNNIINNNNINNNNINNNNKNHTKNSLSSHLSSLKSLSTSALNHLHESLPSTPKILINQLPQGRTSIVDQATITHSSAQILTIAIKKWIVVFLSVHGVVSSGSLAFALIRKKRASSRGESRPLSRVIKTVWSDPTTTRLATFLGSYSALWTLAYPALLKLKATGSSSSADHETSKTSTGQPHRRSLEQFLAHWAAAIAGAVAGLALLAQTKQERVNLGQNIFCRGLYTLLKHRPLFKFPQGDLLLFGISNAQILSAFVLNPSSLPQWYWHWIRRVGSLDVAFLDLHRHISSGARPDSALLELAIERTKPRTANNERKLASWLASPDLLAMPCAPCHLNHALSDNCILGNGIRTWGAFKSMLPTYAILHLIPALLFRGKLLIKSPVFFLLSVVKKTASSALFLATFVWIVLHSVCIPTKIYEHSGGQVRFGGTKWNALVGFSTALALLWEDPRRRGELALYCAPKALASVWIVLKSRGLVRSIRYGEMALASAGTAMLMHCFVHAPESMPALIRGTLGQLVDPHLPDRTRGARPSTVAHILSPPPDVLGLANRQPRVDVKKPEKEQVDYLSGVEQSSN